MTAMVLAAALAALVFGAAPGARNWREAAIGAMVAFGACVAVITEMLGAFGLLRPVPLCVCWLLVTGAALAWGRRPGPRPPLPGFTGWFEAASIAAVLGIAVLVGIVAVVAAPNNTDAMSYHMPRVVYWAQAGSVAFFPTTFYPQIMLQPLAEYFILHTYVLSGGDRLANLAQFFGFLGSIAAVSLIAEALGASRRGQAMAAVFCATIPNAILQASGAKNDCLLAFWLAAMAYFGLRYVAEPRRAGLAGVGLAFGLALMTKGTAYIFAPVMLAAVLGPGIRKWRREWPAVAAALALGVLILNGPQYGRNLQFAGSPLGFDSAHGDGAFRWRNERFGLRTTASNVLRTLAEHLGARSPEWNRGVYQFVLAAHRAIGADPNDPATTWRRTTYQPPVNSNHEANSPNRWQLLFIVAIGIPLAVAARRREERAWFWYYAGVAGAFLLFCSYLKWQPYLIRLQLPIFVLASALAGWFADRVRFPLVQAAVVLFLVNNTRPYLVENWTRPLKGPRSIFRVSREDSYFADMGGFGGKSEYVEAAARTRASGCTEIGIDDDNFPLEYPYEALLRAENPRVHFQHAGVTNLSARYARPEPPPCAVLCLNCAANPQKAALHSRTGPPVRIGRFLLFLSPGGAQSGSNGTR